LRLRRYSSGGGTTRGLIAVMENNSMIVYTQP
jgi:hypothetical protein